MATTVENFVGQAMTLPSESRARLADLLVESLDGDELGRIDHRWTAEAKRRRDEVRTGQVETIPGDEALRKTGPSNLDSLASADPKVIEQVCVDEAEARLDAYERGEIGALAAEEAIAWLNTQSARL